MINTRKISTRALTLLSALLISFVSLQAQEYTEGVKNGFIRVKFKSGVIQDIKGLDISYKKGIAKTNIDEVDRLNESYKVLSMERVIPYSAEHDAKHRKHGLHLWYEIKFDTTSTQVVANGKKGATLHMKDVYRDLDEIDYTELVLEKAMIMPYSVRAIPAETSTKGMAEDLIYNDPLLEKQWHYNNTGQSGGTPGEDIRLFDAWEITSGSRDIIVSIHDEGVDVEHADLEENIWINEMELNGEPNYDDDGNGYKDDIYGFNFADNIGTIPAENHGTHTAGVIGAVNNNGIGVSGIAGGTGNSDGVLLMSCRILGGRSSSNTPASYVYAADNGALISQNSWGYATPDAYEQVVLDAIDYFIAEAGNYPGSPMRGGVVICAAGNDNIEGKHYPAAYESCIAVAGLDAFSYKAPYSNYGDWVDIAAPGGNVDDDDGTVGNDSDFSNGVLSTIKNDGFGYLDGTSMACPHVSGVAALVASQYGGEGFTNDMLTAHLMTGVREEIYELAPNIPHLGKLGEGITNAEFALAQDGKLPPVMVSDLELLRLAQDEVTLSWTVPADPDDEIPYSFEVFYSEFEISDESLDLARFQEFRNIQGADEIVSYDLEGLKATTRYYFSVRGVDRWGNMADLSNVISGTTTEGPEAEIDTAKKALQIHIDVKTLETGADSLTLFNYGEGILRWEAMTRHSSAEAMNSASAEGLDYPVVQEETYQKEAKLLVVPLNAAAPLSNIQESNDEEMSYLDPASWNYWTLGETDTSFTNSSATRFYVSQDEGFNLTQIDAKLQHNSETGPVIVEVYEGENIETAQLMLAQELTDTDSDWDHIELVNHLYFKKGSFFWTVFHVPSGNPFPLVAGLEEDEADSRNCYLSLNMGHTWVMLEDAYYDNQIVWAVYAMSQYLDIGEYITLMPDSGEVYSMDSVVITGQVDGSEMINGSYTGNLDFQTNETGRPLRSIPVEVIISGHEPELSSPLRPDFGGVMVGRDKTLEVAIQNVGFGRFSYQSIDISNPQFTYVSGRNQVFEAKTEQTLVFRFTPEGASSEFANVTLRDASGYSLQFQLTGVGYEPPVAELHPASDTFNLSNGYNLSIGDTVHGDFILKNAGSYPLDYYMPAYADGSNMEDIPDDIHKFGYISRIDSMGVNPEFIWEDISGKGEDVTEFLTGNMTENIFHQVDLGFEFPFFGTKETSVYVSRYGLLSFDTEGSIWTRLPLIYQYPYTPQRLISAWGIESDFASAGFGKVYYKRFMDRFVVQYDSIPWEDGWYEGASATFQIVIHDNGNINFYYKDIHVDPWVLPWGGVNDLLWKFTYIGLEDKTLNDGIRIHDQYSPAFTYRDGSVIEFINPGLGLLYDVTSTQGTLNPGDSVEINYSLATDSLYVQEYNEVLPIVCNDPFNNPLLFLVNFEISGGGESHVEINTESIDLGLVFQYDSVSSFLSFENTGLATDSIVSASFDTGHFRIHGAIPEILKPRRSLYYPVSIVSDELGTYSDSLRIDFKSGQQFVVYLSGDIVSGPEISIDPAAISATIPSGNVFTETISVDNSGDYDLSLTTHWNDWIDIRPVLPRQQDTLDIDYRWETSLEEDGPGYRWVEIADTGIQVQGLDSWGGINWTGAIPLPFTFNFYGIDYDTMYIGYAGLISFTPDQGGDYRFGGPHIPYHMEPDNFIAPLWVGGGKDWEGAYPQTGQYYYMDDEKIIVEWRDYINGFSMGLPISFQVILYRNHKIKFQYKTYEPLDLNHTPEYSVIGVENHDASKGIEIAHYSGLVSQDMSIALYPVITDTIAIGESRDYTVSVNAEALYAGEYLMDMELQNNDPLNKDLTLPVSLTITGKEAFSGPDSLYFGDLFIKGGDSNYDSHMVEFSIENPGTDMLSLNKFTQEFASEVLVEAYVYALNGLGEYQWGWHPVIQQNPWDTKITPIEVAPATNLKLRASIIPEDAADLDHNLIIATSLGTRFIPVIASTFFPPVVDIDQDSIIVFSQTKEFAETRTLRIANTQGGYPLSYELQLEYDRDAGETVPELSISPSSHSDDMHGAYLVSKIPVTAYSNEGSKAEEIDYNRILSHDTDTVPATLIGYGGGMTFHTATRYFAPADGFNLGAVQTWYVPEHLLESQVKVKIYGGSTDIYQANLLYEEVFTHTVEEEDRLGSLVTFTLGEAILFYPNEPFFIEFGFDAVLEFPQGIVAEMGESINRFMFGPGDLWYDLAGIGEPYNTTGWMVRAVEVEYANSVWVTLDSPIKGQIEPGSSADIAISFDGRQAQRGKNYAKLRVLSNDPDQEETESTLLLWINAGPIIEVDKTEYMLLENETLEIEATAYDMEGDDFNMILSRPNGFTRWEYTDEVLKITLEPGYEDEGLHDMEILAIDEHGNAGSQIIFVEVLNVNRPPVPVEIGEIGLKVDGGYRLLTEADMFIDPDGDKMVVTAASEDSDITRVYESGSDLLLEGMSQGTAIVYLTATDIFGAQAENQFLSSVRVPNSVEETDGTGFSVFPNPVQDHCMIQLDSGTEVTRVDVMDITGRIVLTYENILVGKDAIRLNLDELFPGSYTIVVQHESTVHSSVITKL